MSKRLKILGIFFLSTLLLIPSGSEARRDLEDEVQDFTVAERAFQDKFYDFASQELERFLEYYPHSDQFGQAKLLLGKSYLELGKPYKALQHFSELLNDPRFKALKDQALYWSAEVHLRGKDTKTAATFYQELIDYYPQSANLPYAVYSLAWCQEAQMKLKEAEALYGQFISRFPDHALLEEAIVRKMATLLRQKKFEEMLSASSAFSTDRPNSSWKGEVFYLRGEAFFEQEKFKEAIGAYEEALKAIEGKPWRSSARLNEGWSYLKIQEIDKALSLFENLVQSASVRDAALFGAAACHRARGDSEKAIAMLDELLKRPEESDWRNKAMLEKAELYSKLSKYGEAVKTYQKLLENPLPSREGSLAHYGLGWALLRMGSAEEAISEFQKVSQGAPETELRVQALSRIGDIYQDRRDFKRAVENYETVLKEYAFALEADYAAYQIAFSYLTAGEFQTAKSAYEAFLTKFPKSLYRFQARYDLGMAYFQTGDFAEAKSHFLQVKEAHPTDELYFLSLFQIGNSLYNLKEYEKALAIFQEIIPKAPEHLASLARYETGWCFYQMGKRQEAIKTFQEYLSKYPDSEMAPDIHFWFAEYYERQKDYPRSEEHFKILLDKFPQSPMLDEVLFRFSGIASEKKAYDKAVQLIDELLRRFPNSSLVGESLLRKSEIFFLLGSPAVGRQVLEQILTQFPKTPLEKRAARKIGNLLRDKEDYAGAISYLQRAKTGDEYEPNAQIQFEIGECYEALGQADKALEEFLRLTYLYPKSTYWVMRSNLKTGALFEKQGKWEEAVKTYEKLAGWNRLEEAEVARERLKWIRSQVLTQKAHSN